MRNGETQETTQTRETWTSDRLWDLRNEIVRWQWQCDPKALDITADVVAFVEEQWKARMEEEAGARSPAHV